MTCYIFVSILKWDGKFRYGIAQTTVFYAKM